MSPPTVRRRACIAITVATASVLALVPAAEAKTPKCKRGQMVLKINRKSVCRSTKSLFPAPKAGDDLQLGFKRALAFGPARARGRRVATLSSVLGKRRAAAVRRKLLKALPRLIARTRPTARAAAASDCVQNFPDFQEKLNGGSVGVNNGQGQISANAGAGKSVTVTFPAGDCSRFKVPPCPTAAGAVDGHDQRGREFHLVITDGNQVVLSELFSDTAQTTLHGQVGADAKLDYLQIDDVLKHVARLGGSSQADTYTEDGTITRSVRVNMRTGAQVPKDPVMTVITRLNGLSPGAGYQVNRGYVLLVASAADYAAMLDREISNYRNLETGWNNANACAHIDWSPAVNTLTLHKDDHGQASGAITASEGGTAADGVTTIVSQSNGTFSPAAVNGGSPAFAYTVTSPDAGTLALSVHATSTAGVATSSWTQPIAASDWPVKQISGTFSGQDHNGTITKTWNGFATWVRAKNLDQGNTFRALSLASGSYTATVTGRAFDCDVNGQKQFTIGASPSTASFKVFNPASDVVNGAGKPDWQLPWTYTWFTMPPSETMMDATLSNCADSGNNGSTLTFGAPQPTSSFDGSTADGFRFSGSNDFPNPNSGEVWDFTGTS